MHSTCACDTVFTLIRLIDSRIIFFWKEEHRLSLIHICYFDLNNTRFSSSSPINPFHFPKEVYAIQCLNAVLLSSQYEDYHHILTTAVLFQPLSGHLTTISSLGFVALANPKELCCADQVIPSCLPGSIFPSGEGTSRLQSFLLFFSFCLGNLWLSERVAVDKTQTASQPFLTTVT